MIGPFEECWIRIVKAKDGAVTLEYGVRDAAGEAFQDRYSLVEGEYLKLQRDRAAREVTE